MTTGATGASPRTSISAVAGAVLGRGLTSKTLASDVAKVAGLTEARRVRGLVAKVPALVEAQRQGIAAARMARTVRVARSAKASRRTYMLDAVAARFGKPAGLIASATLAGLYGRIALVMRDVAARASGVALLAAAALGWRFEHQSSSVFPDRPGTSSLCHLPPASQPLIIAAGHGTTTLLTGPPRTLACAA